MPSGRAPGRGAAGVQLGIAVRVNNATPRTRRGEIQQTASWTEVLWVARAVHRPSRSTDRRFGGPRCRGSVQRLRHHAKASAKPL